MLQLLCPLLLLRILCTLYPLLRTLRVNTHHHHHAGNIWLEVGRDKVDVGLCVKNAGKGLYVPDFATPIGEGEKQGGWHALFPPPFLRARMCVRVCNGAVCLCTCV